MAGEIDYSEFQEEKAGDNILARLYQTALLAREAKREVENAEAQLQAAKLRHQDLTQRQLPELMDEAGQKACTVKDGTVLKVAEVIRASISEERKLPAFDWLRDNGHGSIIKNQVSLQFGRNEEQKAEAAIKALESLHFRPEQKMTVAPQTLAKLIGELMKEGVDVPMELFGAFVQREVRLS